MSLYLRQLELGPMQNLVYLVGVEGREETAVIDPAWDLGAILARIEEDGRRLTHALVTHRHYDHDNALPDVLALGGVRAFAHRDEVHALSCGVPASELTAVDAGDIIDVGGLPIRCVHTPGHTPGSQCFHLEADGGALLSGDTVFVGACGRCDLEGGDPERMFDSLRRVLGALPGETKLYPGHDYGDVRVSTLARERAHNPYFRLDALNAFLSLRMRPRS